MCEPKLEDIGLVCTVEEAIENVFVALGVLDAKSIEIGTVLLPLFGAGGMELYPERIMNALLTSAKKHLPRLNTLRRILFVELNPAKAEALNQAMNKVLGRVKVILPRGELIKGVRQEI